MLRTWMVFPNIQYKVKDGERGRQKERGRIEKESMGGRWKEWGRRQEEGRRENLKRKKAVQSVRTWGRRQEEGSKKPRRKRRYSVKHVGTQMGGRGKNGTEDKRKEEGKI